MSNSKIIDIFKKLKKKLMLDTPDESITFKLRVIDNTIRYIKNFNKEITLDNFNELGDIKGIGKKTLDKIEEILNTGTLQSLEEYVETTKDIEKDKLLDELKTIVGVGDKVASDFIKKGIVSIDDLLKKIETGDIKTNDKIKLGLKYHNKFFDNIPRSEIDNIKIKLDTIVKKINNKITNNDDMFILEICGSYRRQKSISGDIDLLLSKKNNENIGDYLKIFISILKENNLLVDDITDKNYKTKYMGFLKYKNNYIRRLDVRFVPWKSFYYSLLYFTGSMEFNRTMRLTAKEKGYRLSEYGLYHIGTNNKIDIEVNSEQDIFNFLGIKYLDPKDR